jgi:hypothetical protein
MKMLIETLRTKSEILFYFGLVCLALAILFLVLSRVTCTQVLGINAWIKPFKFSLSIFIYVWTMALFCSYLPNFNMDFYSWSIVVLLGFEIAYIAFQAARGQLSHFNISTPVYSMLYSLMALAATLVTVYTAYIGVLFCTQQPSLPDYYTWSIRLGIFIFVVFAFEGFVMGSRLSHTIGGPDGGEGIPVLNWSRTFGDPRVAHFVGMHALQVLPLVSYYILKDVKWTIGLAILYLVLATYLLYQALQGKPFLKG